MTALLLLALVACVGGGPASSRAGVPPMVSVPEDVVLRLFPGDSAVVPVPVVIREALHVQANPAGDRFLVPLSLRVEGSDGITPGGTLYPPPTALFLDGAATSMPTYEDTVVIEQTFTVAGTCPPGAYRLEGVLTFQACDERRCFAPDSVRTGFSVRVGRP